MDNSRNLIKLGTGLHSHKLLLSRFLWNNLRKFLSQIRETLLFSILYRGCTKHASKNKKTAHESSPGLSIHIIIFIKNNCNTELKVKGFAPATFTFFRVHVTFSFQVEERRSLPTLPCSQREGCHCTALWLCPLNMQLLHHLLYNTMAAVISL